MRNQRTIFIICLCFVLALSSCIFNKKIIYLKSEKESGLVPGMDVRVMGCKIGTIDKIYLTPDFKTLAKIKFKDEIALPVRSKYTVESTDMFGGKVLNILPGPAKRCVNYGDTIHVSFNEKNVFGDSLFTKAGHFMERMMNDSLVIEVRDSSY